MKSILLFLPVLWLTACASGPDFPTENVNRQLHPPQAAVADAVGQRVIWGGLIIATRNLQDRTEMEVLAYPLDRRQLPDTAAKPLGRFLAERSGYLEPVDYAAGRLVTLTGTVGEPRAGKVQDTDYTYPVVSITAIHLWPVSEGRGTDTQLHFGIGVIFR